jgi:hypothetical protein
MDEGPYTPKWRAHRLWTIAFWLGFLGFVPGVAWIHSLYRARGGSGDIVLPVALGWMIAWAAISYVSTNFRCPRCGELFYRRFDDRPWRQTYRWNPFVRHCMHCGLRKGAPSGDDAT